MRRLHRTFIRGKPTNSPCRQRIESILANISPKLESTIVYQVVSLKLLTTIIVMRHYSDKFTLLPNEICQLKEEVFLCNYCRKLRVKDQYCICSCDQLKLAPCYPSGYNDINIIVDQVHVCRHVAAKTLEKYHGDIVDVIVELSTPTSI